MNNATAALTNFYIIASFVGGSKTMFNYTTQVIKAEQTNSISDSFASGLGGCDETTVAGYDIPDDRLINVGKGHTTVKIYYETYNVKDQIDVIYEGANIFSTGCVGTSKEQSATLRLDKSASGFHVKVSPKCQGGSDTQWTYRVGCPDNVLTCISNQCYCGVKKQNSKQVNQPTSDGCGAHNDVTYKMIHHIGEKMKFTPLCNQHDVCYGTCNSNRDSCDDNFCSSMTNLCKGEKLCLKWADVFCNSVRKFASPAYQNAQKEDCTCSS